MVQKIRKKETSKISTFIIVKDEEDTILRALESAAKFSDEIVVGIDQLSVDKTEEIVNAFEFPKKIVYKFEWDDNFARARNSGIDKCTGDWIFQLDAHEYVRPGDEKKIIEFAKKEHGFKVLAIELWDWENKEWNLTPKSAFLQEHMFKKGIRYNEDIAMHNKLDISLFDADKEMLLDPRIVIYHQRTAVNHEKRRKQRLEMGVKIFGKKIEENPDDLRSRFYLAMTYSDSSDIEHTIEHLEKFVDTVNEKGYEPKQEGMVYKAYWKLGGAYITQAYNIKEEKNEAVKIAALELAIYYLEKAVEMRADSPHVYLFLGNAYEGLGNKRQALRYYSLSASSKTERDNPSPIVMTNTFSPYKAIARTLMVEGKWAEALQVSLQGWYQAPDPELKIIVNDSALRMAEQIPPGDPNKKNLYVVNDTDQFTQRLMREWEKEYNVIYDREYNPVHALWSHLTYCEWGWKSLANMTQGLKFPRRIVARAHRFDVYSKEWQHVVWENVDHMIFTSEHIKETAGELPCETSIIENGVDTNYWLPLKSFDEKTIVLTAAVRLWKNIPYALDLMAKLPDYKLYIVGPNNIDKCLNEFIEYKIDKMGLRDRVALVGFLGDVREFYREYKPSIVLSTSMTEGLPYNILECMSMGMRPVIYGYKGSEKQFRDFVVDNVCDMPDAIQNRPHEPEKYRRIVERRYSFSREYSEYQKVFKKVLDIKIEGEK